MAGEPLLAVDRLTVEYPASDGGWRRVVEDVSLAVHQGERLALVGESGSGKSVTALACLGLVQAPGRRAGGRVTVAGTDLDAAGAEDLRRVRGGAAGLVFQEPSSCLDPVYTVGFQLRETVRSHRRLATTAVHSEARRLLEEVALPDVPRVLASYPHQLSGGQLQRVLIALALAGRPRLLIADEPTSALDLLTQADILDLLERLTREQALGLLLISHDLAMVRGAVDRVAVMFAGRVVEEGDTESIFASPTHPYTRRLLAAAAYRDDAQEAAPGATPAVAGCRYATRCPHPEPACHDREPEMLAAAPGHRVRCPVTLAAAALPRGEGSRG